MSAAPEEFKYYYKRKPPKNTTATVATTTTTVATTILRQNSGLLVTHLPSSDEKTISQITTTNQNLGQVVTQLAAGVSAAHTFTTHHDLHLHPSQTLTLESKISAITVSLSVLLSRLNHPISLPLHRLHPPTQPFFHRLLSLPPLDPAFTDCFRISKPSFSLLLHLISPSLSSISLPPNSVLAAALFRLAHGASYKAVARRFGFETSGEACRAFYVVCKAVCENLGHLFELRSDISRVIAGFGWMSLPNCCGVLGIDCFKVGENGGLMVQALVDSEGRFLDVSAGWSSRTKPDSILRQSELCSSVEEKRDLLNGTSFELSDGNAVQQYILGESCFPLLPWLLTPYLGDDGLDSNERAFNLVHTRGMKLVATAFGRLRAQWRILDRDWKDECVESFPFVAVACCLLHNFLIKSREEFTDRNPGYSRVCELPHYESEVCENALRIRDALASHLCRVISMC